MYNQNGKPRRLFPSRRFSEGSKPILKSTGEFFATSNCVFETGNAVNLTTFQALEKIFPIVKQVPYALHLSQCLRALLTLVKEEIVKTDFSKISNRLAGLWDYLRSIPIPAARTAWIQKLWRSCSLTDYDKISPVPAQSNRKALHWESCASHAKVWQE